MNLSSENADPYAAIAEFYDLEHDEFDDDLGFYLNLSTLQGGPVLELACGTGRIIAPLLAAGLKITGLDASAAMLDRARTRLTSIRHGSGLTLHRGSMTSPETIPGGPFGVVILGLNGLWHATTSEEQRRVLRAAGSALRPGGQLLLDVANPASPSFLDGDLQVLLEGVRPLPDGGRVDKFSSRRFDASEQTIEVAIWYDLTTADGAVKRIHSNFTQRYVHRSELELMLEFAGFESWKVFGGYELEPFGEGSDRIAVVAER